MLESRILKIQKNWKAFTPEQRFFLSYGRIWASNVAPQFVAYLVNSDTHSPNNQRVNAALPMIDAWYDAFNIKAGDKLFVPMRTEHTSGNQKNYLERNYLMYNYQRLVKSVLD
jgi:predicted metalloendopeptidase